MLRHTKSAVDVIGAMAGRIGERRTVREISDLAFALSRDQVNNALRALLREGIIDRTPIEPYKYGIRTDLAGEQHSWVQDALKHCQAIKCESQDSEKAKYQRAIQRDEWVKVLVVEEILEHEALRGCRTIGVLTTIRSEVVDWIKENISGDWTINQCPFALSFEDEAEAALFRLRWA